MCWVHSEEFRIYSWELNVHWWPVGNHFCIEQFSPRSRRCHCWPTRSSGSIPSCVAQGLWAAGAPVWSPSGPWSGCDRDSGASTSSGWWQSRYQTPQRALMLQRRQKHQELVLHLILSGGKEAKFEFRFLVYAGETIPNASLGWVHYWGCFRPFILCIPPINMVHIEKIFSESVLAETFPKPTLVKLLRAKYSDVT